METVELKLHKLLEEIKDVHIIKKDLKGISTLATYGALVEDINLHLETPIFNMSYQLNVGTEEYTEELELSSSSCGTKVREEMVRPTFNVGNIADRPKLELLDSNVDRILAFAELCNQLPQDVLADLSTYVFSSQIATLQKEERYVGADEYFEQDEDATIDYLRELYKLKASDNIVERLITQVPTSYYIDLVVDPYLDTTNQALLTVKHETFSFVQSVTVEQNTIVISTSFEYFEVPFANYKNTRKVSFPTESKEVFDYAYTEELKELFNLALSYTAIEKLQIK